MSTTQVTPSTENSQPTITQAVEQAIASQEVDASNPQQTNQQVVPPDSSQSPQEKAANQQTQPQTQTQIQEPTSEEIKQALNLQRMLMDPKTAPAALKMMGEMLGLEVAPQKQQTTQEAAKQPTIAEILTANLGEEYKFLAPNLAKAMEQIVGLHVAPLQTQLQQNKLEVEFNNAVAELNKTSQGDFDKHQATVLQLMDRLKPGQGVSIHDYLNELYSLAKGKSPLVSTPNKQVQQVVDKMQRNAQENIPSPSAATENRVVKGPALPTLEQSIMAALNGESFE